MSNEQVEMSPMRSRHWQRSRSARWTSYKPCERGSSASERKEERLAERQTKEKDTFVTGRMRPLELAWQEWERQTEPYPKTHYIGKKPFIDEFRRYGDAIAWLEIGDDCITITKIEALKTGKGAARRLVEFLKSLADKYRVRLFGNAVVYPPDVPTPVGPLLSQQELEAWYAKMGFKLRKIAGTTITGIWYPDFPSE